MHNRNKNLPIYCNLIHAHLLVPVRPVCLVCKLTQCVLCNKDIGWLVLCKLSNQSKHTTLDPGYWLGPCMPRPLGSQSKLNHIRVSMCKNLLFYLLSIRTIIMLSNVIFDALCNLTTQAGGNL